MSALPLNTADQFIKSMNVTSTMYTPTAQEAMRAAILKGTISPTKKPAAPKKPLGFEEIIVPQIPRKVYDPAKNTAPSPFPKWAIYGLLGTGILILLMGTKGR